MREGLNYIRIYSTKTNVHCCALMYEIYLNAIFSSSGDISQELCSCFVLSSYFGLSPVCVVCICLGRANGTGAVRGLSRYLWRHPKAYPFNLEIDFFIITKTREYFGWYCIELSGCLMEPIAIPLRHSLIHYQHISVLFVIILFI